MSGMAYVVYLAWQGVSHGIAWLVFQQWAWHGQWTVGGVVRSGMIVWHGSKGGH